jgi:integrase
MTYLYKRGSIYYFRISVPQDLRDQIQTREIIKSLKTHYYNQARQLVTPLLREVELLFGCIRSGLMDQNQIKQALSALLREQQSAMKATKFSGSYAACFSTAQTPSIPEKMLLIQNSGFSATERVAAYQNLRASIIDQLSQYDTTDMESLAKQVFNITPDDNGYQQACLELMRFEAEHCQALIDLTQGDMTSYDALRERYTERPSPTETASTAVPVQIIMPDNPPQQPETPTMLLSEAIEKYKARKQGKKAWASKTVYENERNFNVILFVAEDGPITRFNDIDFCEGIANRFRNLPKDMNKRPAFKNLNIHQVLDLNDPKKIGIDRTNKYLEYLSAVINFGIKARWLQINHIEDLKVQKPRGHKPSEEKDPYDNDDINYLLTGLKTVFNREEPEKLWISTLMLFHGCRPIDLVRITKDKFKTIDGILCMDLSSKTEAGVRTVPVHPFVLHECGFDRFLATIEENRALWSKKLTFNETKNADSHERWYNRTFEPKYVSNAPKKSLYSLRHSFITNLKHAGVTPYVIKEIVGHEKGLPEQDITFDRYGKEYSPAKKLEALNSLNYNVYLEPFKKFCQSIDWEQRHPPATK